MKSRHLALLCALVTAGPAVAQVDDCRFPSQDAFSVPDFRAEPLQREIDGLRQRIQRDDKVEPARQRLAEITVELARWIERLEASAQEERLATVREIISKHLPDTMWRIGYMGRNGSAGALSAQGTLHRHGIVLEQDLEKACGFYAEASALEDMHGIYRESVCVAEENPRKSLLLMNRAGEMGHPSAAVALGLVCLDSRPRDDTCGLRWFCHAARAGRPRAAGMAGWMLEEGRGADRDPQSAVVLYRFAAERGDQLAQNNLGKLLETGTYVSADISEAARWYREAAESGFGPAQVNLGRLYAEGNGVPLDLERSIYWLRKAESQGIAQATEILDWMRDNLLPKADGS